MAAEREVMEELGMKIDLSDIRPNFTINFSNGFDDYYLVEKDFDISELVLQEEEVKEARWVGKEELLQMQEEGIFIPYWFLDKLFDIRELNDAARNKASAIKIGYAKQRNLASWMSLVEIVKLNFPGLETDEKVREYENMVIKNMERNTAICALDGNMVVGILLFSIENNMISCMAVHPEYRRKGIATKMVKLMLKNFNSKEDIAVETFREGDEKGNIARAFYKAIGFEEGGLCCFENGYPLQKFILKQNAVIGKKVTVTVDRPLGSYHPKHKDIYYTVNYGYIDGVFAADGEEQDAYILGIDEPVTTFNGKVIAVIHRNDDIEEKWIVCPQNMTFTEDEIREKVFFQERYFDSYIIMN